MVCGTLHSANKKHKVSSVGGSTDDAFPTILLFKNFSDDLIPYDSGSSKSKMGVSPKNAALPSTDVWYILSHPKTIIQLSLSAV
jgi:hypothetical protein